MDSRFDLQFLLPVLNLGSEIAGLTHPSLHLWGGSATSCPVPFVTFPQPLPEDRHCGCSTPDLQPSAGYCWLVSRCREKTLTTAEPIAPEVPRWAHKLTTSQRQLSSCPSLLSQGLLLLVACPFPPLSSPSWLLHFFHSVLLSIYRQGNVTFHTGSLHALPCRVGWIKPLPSPSWLDISPPPSPPLHTSQAKDSSLPPSFFFHPSCLQCKPKTQDPAEGKCSLKSSPQTLLRKCKRRREKKPRQPTSCGWGFARGRWLQALGDSLSPFSRAWDLSSSSFRQSLFRQMVSPPVQVGLGYCGCSESCALKCVIAKPKNNLLLFF